MSAAANGSRLVFEDWAMPDPNNESLIEALHALRWFPEEMTAGQRYLVGAAADAYLHLAAHPAPTKSVVAQLRQLRRAVRAKAGQP